MRGEDASDIKKNVSRAEFNKEVLDDLNRLAVENRFSGLEKIKKIHLTLDPFTPESELVTPTLKLKRPQLKNFYQKELSDMYANK
jgi:long-chain acyl-CoA synthetase